MNSWRHILYIPLISVCMASAENGVITPNKREVEALGSTVARAYLERFFIIDKRLVFTEPADMNDIPREGVEWARLDAPIFASDYPSYSMAVHQQSGRFWLISSGGYSGSQFVSTGLTSALVDGQHAAPADCPQTEGLLSFSDK